MIIYKFDGNRAFAGSVEQPETAPIPRGSTLITPPELSEGETAIFEGSAWVVVANYSPPAEHVPVVIVPQEVTALQGMKAIDAAGLAAAYTVWASDPERTFLEKAFIDKALTWERDNEVILAAQVALGLTDEQVDSLFILAATL